MNRTALLTLCVVMGCLLAAGMAGAQVATGTPAFGSYGGGPFDQINLGNLNTYFQIPIFHRAGRGTDFDYTFSYNSSVWAPVGASGQQVWLPSGNWGWTTPSWTGATAGYLTAVGSAVGYFTYFISSTVCAGPPPNFPPGLIYTGNGLVYTDSKGAGHYFPVQFVFNLCTGEQSSTPLPVSASDDSGYTLVVGGVMRRDGTLLHPPSNREELSTPSLTDANGNKITSEYVNNQLKFRDTLDTVVLKISGEATPSSDIVLTYPAPNSQGEISHIIHYDSYNIATYFNCGATQYVAPGVSLIKQIDLPDGNKYLFEYEASKDPNHLNYKTGRVKV